MTINEILEKLNSLFPSAEFTIPPKLSFGIMTTNWAFKKCKIDQTTPIESAIAIKLELEEKIRSENLPLVVNLVGPYVNLDLEIGFFTKWILDLDKIKEDNFNIGAIDSKKNVVMEFICPNLAKPLHAGHILQANYGFSLYNILSLKYKNIIRNCFWGDLGVQFGFVIWAWKELEKREFIEYNLNDKNITISKKKYLENPVDSLVNLYVWANIQSEIDPEIANIARIEHLKLESKDQGNYKIWAKIKQDSQEVVEKMLEKIRISPFDLNNGEFSALGEGQKLMEFIIDNNIGKAENLGRYFQFDEIDGDFGSEKEIKNLGRAYLIESKTGYTTYILRDVAAKIMYARDQEIDMQIIMVGNEQKHHFDQVFAITNYLSRHPKFISVYGEKIANKLHLENLNYILNGMLNLEDGKMSTRKGNFVTAGEILEKLENAQIAKSSGSELSKTDINTVSLSALRWFNLNKDIATNTILNFGEILKFEGNTGVYQLYTVARLRSILRKNKNENGENFDLGTLNLTEQEIIRKSYLLPFILDRIISTKKIHYLTTFLFEFSDLVNSWYAKYSIVGENDPARKQSLIIFTSKIEVFLTQTLKLLGIDCLDQL